MALDVDAPVGALAAHSMQTVQFSSLRAMTPRARGGGASFTCGYCTVTAGFMHRLERDAEALDQAGELGHSEHHLEDAGDDDVHQRERDQELPGERLQLVLTEPGVGEADPEDEEGDEHDLPEEHQRAETFM